MMLEKQIFDLVQIADPDNPIQFVHNIVQGLAIEKQKEMILNCKDCKICSSIKSMGHGNPNAQVLIIGDNMTEDEMLNSNDSAFSGESGDILKQVFDKLGINTEELYFTNAIHCWPCKNINNESMARPPKKEEINNCLIFINHLIEIIKPRAIILLGNVTMNIFKNGILSKDRGNWIDIKGIPALPTYHPDCFINPEDFEDEEMINMKQWDFFEDMQKVFDFLKDKYPNSNLFL